MLGTFAPFAKFFFKFDPVCIDNNVFRLHYKVMIIMMMMMIVIMMMMMMVIMMMIHYQATVMILTLATVLVTSRQYIGDPIDCMVDVSLTLIRFYDFDINEGDWIGLEKVATELGHLPSLLYAFQNWRPL